MCRSRTECQLGSVYKQRTDLTWSTGHSETHDLDIRVVEMCLLLPLKFSECKQCTNDQKFRRNVFSRGSHKCCQHIHNCRGKYLLFCPNLFNPVSRFERVGLQVPVLTKVQWTGGTGEERGTVYFYTRPTFILLFPTLGS